MYFNGVSYIYRIILSKPSFNVLNSDIDNIGVFLNFVSDAHVDVTIPNADDHTAQNGGIDFSREVNGFVRLQE